MSSPEQFGFEPDADGNINFLTVETEFQIHNFQEYTEWFAALVRVAYMNEGFMPIAIFPNAPQGWNRET